MQEQHDLPHNLLFRPAGDDPGRTFGANTRHLPQAVRLLLDEVEHCFAESPHLPLGVDRADTADHARSEISLDPLKRGRRAGLQEGGTELLTVGAVVHPGATHLDELTGTDQHGHGRRRSPGPCGPSP